ncbi:virulence factor [Bhargavaea cecembensis]|uniref:Virulence factor n=1 Tax=Bhargavaea cecembensis TaxID=394098 RepID=A0A161SPK5_9BACL|nr:virulence factor [Bhargavaea cecembensis]KZE40233.1 virulence factor [Bhargavaea cecembensis]
MKIITIEPTPSPNSMKVVIDRELPFGKAFNYKPDNLEEAPEFIRQIFEIEGVKGIYQVMDFLAIERSGKYDWEPILAGVREVFGEEQEAGTGATEADEHFGEVYIHVQQYKGVPIQVKVFDDQVEERFGLGQRFVDVMSALMEGDDENYILQRKWADYGIRYGDKKEIGEEVVKEIEAAYPQERLDAIKEAGSETKEAPVLGRRRVTLEEYRAAGSWEERFRLLDQLPDPDMTDVPLLMEALKDEKMSIRRLAVVYLGMIEDPAVVPYIEKAMEDKSAPVRRTAADAMSDLGFSEFEDLAIRTLKDKSKIVRWRGAMYLYETGTEKALPALQELEDDPEFEVKLQAKMAAARIAGGEEAKGSMWKQMTEMRTKAKGE